MNTGTAIPKLLRVLSKIQAFRAAEEAKLSSYGCSCGRKLGEVTSINITMLEAGVKTTVDEETGIQNYAFNVIPEVARAGFDTRVRIHSSYHVKNNKKSNTPRTQVRILIRTEVRP